MLNYHTDLMKGIEAKGAITYVGGDKTAHMEKCIEIMDKEISLLREDIYDDFVKELCGEDKIRCIVLNIPFKLPVAFAGRSRLGIKVDEKEELFTVVLSIFPSDINTTILCFSTFLKNEEKFLAILSQYDDMLSLLSFIESWIIYGSDCWFINPEY